jgi:hypothetical protein
MLPSALPFGARFGSRFEGGGRSPATLDWTNNKIPVDNLELGPIKRACGELKRTFEWISFAHISLEMNVFADGISKQALLLHEGTYIEEEFSETVLLLDMEVRYPWSSFAFDFC